MILYYRRIMIIIYWTIIRLMPGNLTTVSLKYLQVRTHGCMNFWKERMKETLLALTVD